MYAQPTRGPAVPPVVRHIFLAKPMKPVPLAPLPPSGVLAELAARGSR